MIVGGVLGYVDQDRRLHEALADRVGAAEHGPAAPGKRVVDVPADHVELLRHRDRPDLAGPAPACRVPWPGSVISATNSS